MAVSIDRELDYLKKIPEFGRFLNQALLRMVENLNNLALNTGANSNGHFQAPSTPQGLTIKANNAGKVYGVINDQNQLVRGTRYFVEYDTDPSFKQPHVVHMGASRTLHGLELPENDDDGNPQRWYFRAYSQTPSGLPSAPVVYGGDTPTAVNPGGGMNFTLPKSTGSGTAPADGQSAGQGYGKDLHRPATVNIKTNTNIE